MLHLACISTLAFVRNNRYMLNKHYAKMKDSYANGHKPSRPLQKNFVETTKKRATITRYTFLFAMTRTGFEPVLPP